MAQVIFWDVDTQYDFMKADGKLYVPDAEHIIPNLERVRDHRGDILVHKHEFDVFTNPNVLPAVDALAPEDVVLYGVALDVCDRYAIEGFLQHRPNIRLFAVTDAMKPIDRDAAEQMLKEWGEEGVRLVKTSEVVMGGLVEQLVRAGA